MKEKQTLLNDDYFNSIRKTMISIMSILPNFKNWYIFIWTIVFHVLFSHSQEDHSCIINWGQILFPGHPIKNSTSMNSTRASERSLPTAGSRDDRDHSGYFSDRNASFDNRRDPYERGYTSDHDRTRYSVYLHQTTMDSI